MKKQLCKSLESLESDLPLEPVTNLLFFHHWCQQIIISIKINAGLKHPEHVQVIL